MANFEKRITKEGKTVVRVRVRLKGFPVETATFDRLTDAKRWASKIETDIREGRHFKTTEAKRHTLAELIDRYLRDTLPKKSEAMQRDQWRHLTWWKNQVGDRLLADVRPSLPAEYRDRLSNGEGRPKEIFGCLAVPFLLSLVSSAEKKRVEAEARLYEEQLQKKQERMAQEVAHTFVLSNSS